MKVAIPDGSLEHILENEDSSTLRVYLRLQTRAQRRGSNSCRISINDLAHSCGISAPTAIKALRKLRAIGFIETRHYRNPNRPSEHVILDSNSAETEVALVAEPPFPQQTSQKPFATNDDKFREWLRNLTPELFAKIKLIYGIGISQYDLRSYFDEYVLPLEAELQ